MNFTELNLLPELLKALKDEGYESPSMIQERAIPPLLENRDLLGCAQTGTGKTAAFALPILQLLHETSDNSVKTKHIRALILTPTRELAIQINESFNTYGKYLNIKSTVVFGGVSQKPQVDELRRGIDVLVATPGRLNDLISQGIIDIRQVEKFVLDEADRMLDMGFINDVKRVIAQLPKRRQTLLFSATMPTEIIKFVNTILTDPIKITITPVSSTVDSITQSVYFVDKINKQKLLTHLLKDKTITSALVFTRTKHGADRVVKEFAKVNIQALAIHGNKSQNARQNALASFKSGEIRVLIATDIAARGIDIDNLSHVINFDLPNVPETYVHRIGRTGRAGLTGISISFCDFDEKEYLADIEKLIKKPVPLINDQPFPMTIFEPAPKKAPRSPRHNPAPNGQAPKGAKKKTESKGGTGKKSGPAPWKNGKTKSPSSNKISGRPAIRSLKKSSKSGSKANTQRNTTRKP